MFTHIFQNQFKTVRQRTAYPLFSCTFFVFHCSNLHLIMLYSFHVALFLYCTISILQSTPFALFACCSFFLLHFVHIALFPEVQSGLPQTSKMQSFATIISKVAKYCGNVLHPRSSWSPHYASTISMLHFFHVTLISCCTFKY